MLLPSLPNIGAAWLGFDPQLNSDESRASSSCSSGSACLQHLLLGLLQVTALSHSSIPQFQAWLHPLSPLTPPPPPVFLHNHLSFPPSSHFPCSRFLLRKDPSVPSSAWLAAKHLCGCGWPTLPGSQVAVAPPPRSALSVSQPSQSNWPQPVRDSSGPVRDLDRTATHPDQIRYSNSTRQVHQAS